MNAPRRLPLRHLLAAALPVAVLCLAAAPAAAAHISINLDDDNGIRVVDRDVVIDSDADGAEATVEPDGTLRVDGRRVHVAERDRQALVLYNQSVRRIEDRAIDIGIQGAGLAVHAVAEALVAVASGDPHRAERRVRHHAEDLKDNARRLCADVRAVEQLQDTIADCVGEFRPFAVIHLDDDDCQIED
ncbi:MAG TPA: hypothetical protein VGS57_21240 [Thermoanaerobaculia bacterium]|jgi:hypothetical protein|nr:hypothetical protein [Thermoanaerobaculia bacterium]